MPSVLFGIILSAILSATSLLIVLFRVSPLTAPGQALPAFFVTFFLTIGSVSAVLFFFVWKFIPIHSWDLAKIIRISLRQGIMLGFGTSVVVLFYLLGLLTWWIAILIYSVFILIELALNS
jgi:hypothetical protein